jgi:acyl-coenzyme A synthetase/AMP-(fatty) acid ligase
VHGIRVEPEEVEHHLHLITAADEVAVIGWPVENGLVTGLAAFTGPTHLATNEIKRQLARYLPAVMIPKTISTLKHLPRNQNHKIDRKALLSLLIEQRGKP